MSHKSPVHTSSGFSLAEVMVALAIMTVVVLGVATFMRNTERQSQSINQKSDFNSLVNELQNIFNNASTCQAALVSVKVQTNITAALPQEVEIIFGNSNYKQGMKYGSGNSITITQLRFVGRTNNVGGQLGQTAIPLHLEVSRKVDGNASVGGETLKHDFTLIVEVKADGTISACSGMFTNHWVKGIPANSIAYMGGNVGIGTLDPGVRLEVSGTVQAAAFMYSSDLRLKENIREIPDVLQRVLELRGVVYDWKKSASSESSRSQIGFLAQEVEQNFPEAVATDPKTGMKSVAYANLVAPLVESIKEQQRMLEEQQKEIEKIKALLMRK